MSNLNNDFLEEFKALDKLCREIYNSERGVSSYIDDMKRVLPSSSQHIPSWDSALERLIELRHIRNTLSHEVGTLDIIMCNEYDIDWLNNFYNRIFNQTDPLTLLRKSNSNNRIREKKSTATLQQNPKTTYPSLPPKQKKHSFGCLISVAILIATITIILLCNRP